MKNPLTLTGTVVVVLAGCLWAQVPAADETAAVWEPESLWTKLKKGASAW